MSLDIDKFKSRNGSSASEVVVYLTVVILDNLYFCSKNIRKKLYWWHTSADVVHKSSQRMYKM